MLTATVTGRLGKDADVKTSKSDKKYAELNVAESTRRNVNGTWEDVTTWIKVLVFNERDVGTVERFARKGSYIVATGALEVGVWTDKQGNARVNASLVASSIDVPKMGEGGGEKHTRRDYDAPTSGRRDDNRQPPPNDDEIPF